MRNCGSSGTDSSLERRKILEEHQATIAAQIAALQKAHALLTHKIANYRKIEERIRVPNTVRDGSGPRDGGGKLNAGSRPRHGQRN